MTRERQADTASVGAQEYEEAVGFWTWWNEDPEADLALEGPPRETIERLLKQKYGARPLEAEWIAQKAPDTVIDRINLKE